MFHDIHHDFNLVLLNSSAHLGLEEEEEEMIFFLFRWHVSFRYPCMSFVL